MKFATVKKIILALALYLMPVLLIGVGFSAWLIVNNNHKAQTVEGVFNAYDVINTGNFISINGEKGYNHSGIDNLKYNEQGFVVDDVVSTTNGEMRYYLVFNIGEFYNTLKNYDSINLSFALSLSSNSNDCIIFNNLKSVSVAYVFSDTPNYTQGLTNLNCSSVTDTSLKKDNTTVLLQDFSRDKYQASYAGKKMYLEVTYTFGEDATNKFTTLYNNIKSKNVNFKFDVFIEGNGNNET